MKKLLPILLAAVFITTLLASCNNKPSDSSSSAIYESSDTSVIDETAVIDETSITLESSSAPDEKKAWTDVEENVFDGTKTTTEYRDGENDYTVTVEKLNGDGTLFYKSVRTYVNKFLTYDEKVEYDENEEIVERIVTHFDENAKAVRGEKFYKHNGIIQTAEYTFDSKEFVNGGTVKYSDLDGNVLADGKLRYEVIDAYRCTVEDLSVYKDGKKIHEESFGYFFGDIEYIYRDIKDEDGNILLTKKYESIFSQHDVFIYGETKGRIYRWEDKEYYYLEDFHESRSIGRCIRTYKDGFNLDPEMLKDPAALKEYLEKLPKKNILTAIGKQYTEKEAQKRIDEIFDEYDRLTENLFSDKLTDKGSHFYLIASDWEKEADLDS